MHICFPTDFGLVRIDRKRRIMNIARKSHYVPCVYLKRFAGSDGNIFTYRLLVSRPLVKTWKSTKVSAVAYHRDLYTRCVLGTETDEVEKWLNRDFETPADGALDKVQSNAELENTDWEILVRFLACQIVRTPAFFIKMLPTWNRMVPQVLNQTLDDVKEALLRIKLTGQRPSIPEIPEREYLPFRVHREDVPEEKSTRFRTETVVGRGLWIWSMKHTLSNTIKVLHQHHWSIFHAASGLNFFTSDDPVLRLNFDTHSKYDFNGGWGSVGTEIFLPLSPRHLLYTKIGERFSPRGILLSPSETQQFRRMIAKHAHRQIFASCEMPEVRMLRPRRVNADLVDFEKAQWQQWHEEQTQAEAKLIADAPSNRL